MTLLTTPRDSDMKRPMLIAAATFMLSGCVTLPPKSFLVSPEQMARRQVETRRYDGAKEQDIIVASSNVLQDLGYTIENSENQARGHNRK